MYDDIGTRTLLKDVPSLTSGTEGNDRLGFISSDPARRLYKLLIIISRSDVVFTGRNLRRGTFTPYKHINTKALWTLTIIHMIASWKSLDN